MRLEGKRKRDTEGAGVEWRSCRCSGKRTGDRRKAPRLIDPSFLVAKGEERPETREELTDYFGKGPLARKQSDWVGGTTYQVT